MGTGAFWHCVVPPQKYNIIKLQKREVCRNFTTTKITDYYDKINGKCATKLRDLLGLNITDKDYSREVPYYIPMVKTEAPYKIFNDYCRDLIVNDLGIDAACGFSRGYHSCVVVFNPDSVCNLREYSPSAMSYGY